MATAAACQVGLSTIARWESGTVTHSRSLEHAAYRCLLAAWLRFAQTHNPELAEAIRRKWPALDPSALSETNLRNDTKNTGESSPK